MVDGVLPNLRLKLVFFAIPKSQKSKKCKRWTILIRGIALVYIFAMLLVFLLH